MSFSSWAAFMPFMITPMNRLRMIIVPSITRVMNNSGLPMGNAAGARQRPAGRVSFAPRGSG